MDAIPPIIDAPRSINRGRWWIHLILITAYLVGATLFGLGRHTSSHPALSHSAMGLLLVCGVEFLFFGGIIALAFLASRPTVDDLLLRWKGNVLPVLTGAAYSIGLRLALGMVVGILIALLVATHIVTPDWVQNYTRNNRPQVENMIDVTAMRDNPAYFWLTLTVVSFALGGLREELWRSSFLAGLRALWPHHFQSTAGQVGAVCIATVPFGLAHASMGPIAMLSAAVLGLGLGLIMVYHRSIWPAVIAHGFFDATSLAMLPKALEMMRHLPHQ